MLSCFGCGRKQRSDDTEALLPTYDDDTARQRALHAKLHSFQMLRALSTGYMPSTEQVIINLRTILASNLLKADNPDLSDSGVLLVKYVRRWLQNFIELLRSKNSDDEIQDIIWGISKSKMHVNADRLASRASVSRQRADARAGTETLCHRSPFLTSQLHSISERFHYCQPVVDEFKLPAFPQRHGHRAS